VIRVLLILISLHLGVNTKQMIIIVTNGLPLWQNDDRFDVTDKIASIVMPTDVTS